MFKNAKDWVMIRSDLCVLGWKGTSSEGSESWEICHRRGSRQITGAKKTTRSCRRQEPGAVQSESKEKVTKWQNFIPWGR